MRICDTSVRNNTLFRRLLSFVTSSEEPSRARDTAEAVTGELDALWTMIRDQAKNDENCESMCRSRIAESFRMMKKEYTYEQLDDVHAWPRYVKVAVHSSSDPIEDLVDYVNEVNYIFLTKQLSDLSRSVYKKKDEGLIQNMDNFSEAVYLHILRYLAPNDVPSLLALGRMTQNRGEYELARMWFSKVTETEKPFNGVTSLIACFEREVKDYLSGNKGDRLSDIEIKERVRELNRLQCAEYEKWRRIMEKHIVCSDGVNDQYKKDYVALITGYARFERNRGHCDKALRLLDMIPEQYPNLYRVYSEQAMIYQFRPYENSLYDLDKAIELFNKADAAVLDARKTTTVSVKGRKSILMPLANAYFQSGRYEEAADVCERILGIDRMEEKAINLKKRIECIA